MEQKQLFDAYVCTVCGYLYDVESAEQDIKNNPIALAKLDEAWTCPLCGVGTALFDPINLETLGVTQEKI
ncbi:MAG: rubredoxin [Candidatus Babeliales bacterium]